MSRRDYEAMARTLGILRARMGQPSERRVLSAVQEAMSDFFHQQNEGFKPELFAKAVERAESDHRDGEPVDPCGAVPGVGKSMRTTTNKARARTRRERALLLDAIDALAKSSCEMPTLCTGPAMPRAMRTCYRCTILHRAWRMGLVPQKET